MLPVSCMHAYNKRIFYNVLSVWNAVYVPSIHKIVSVVYVVITAFIVVADAMDLLFCLMIS